MPKVTRTQFAGDLAAKVNDNSSGEITPLDLREVFTDLEDSALWHDEAAPGIADGDYGAITVSGGSWSIDDGAVTTAKIDSAALEGSGARLLTTDGGLTEGALHATGADGRMVAAQTATPGTIGAKTAGAGTDRVVIFDSEAGNAFATLRVDQLPAAGGAPAGGVASDPAGIPGAAAIGNVVSLTQADYDAIATPDAATLYLITDAV